MNALLHEGLLGTKHVLHAGIIKRKDGAVKAKSAQFQISVLEYTILEHAFDKPSEVRGQDSAFTFMDGVYKVIRADKMSIYGKQVWMIN